MNLDVWSWILKGESWSRKVKRQKVVWVALLAYGMCVACARASVGQVAVPY